MKYATFMDEISTGLDSAATFDIVSTQRDIAKKLHKTVVMALLQPTAEVFGLIDNVLLLNDGQAMYHGYRDNILPYFESLGFVCPPDRDIADYLLDLGTDQQYQYEMSKASSNHASFPAQLLDFQVSLQTNSGSQVSTRTSTKPWTPHGAVRVFAMPNSTLIR